MVNESRHGRWGASRGEVASPLGGGTPPLRAGRMYQYIEINPKTRNKVDGS
jgi:hypothetical protein